MGVEGAGWRCSLDWPQTSDPPASASRGLKIASTHSVHIGRLSLWASLPLLHSSSRFFFIVFRLVTYFCVCVYTCTWVCMCCSVYACVWGCVRACVRGCENHNQFSHSTLRFLGFKLRSSSRHQALLCTEPCHLPFYTCVLKCTLSFYMCVLKCMLSLFWYLYFQCPFQGILVKFNGFLLSSTFVVLGLKFSCWFE